MGDEKANQPGQTPDPAHQPSQNEGLNMKDDLDRTFEQTDEVWEGMAAGEKPQDYLRRTGRSGLLQDEEGQPEDAANLASEGSSQPGTGTANSGGDAGSQRLALMAKAAAVVGVLLILAAGAFLVLDAGDSNDTTAGGGQQSRGQQQPAQQPAQQQQQAAQQPIQPSGPTDQQLRDANLSPADLPGFYGNCAFEFTAQNDTNVQQSVSSSAEMVTAMGAAAFAGVRSASRSTAACTPYNVASVMGRAKGVPEAEALFDAAVLNYGQRLFNNVATFGATGAWDEAYCQNGTFPPQNIIAVACWVREGDFVGGFFYLLPPNSQQPAIDEGRRDALAFLQRIASLIAR